MNDTALQITVDEQRCRIQIQGALDLFHYQQAKKELAEAADGCGKETAIDLSQVTRLDTAGALLLQHMLQPGRKSKHHLKLEHLRPEHQALFDLVAQTKPGKPPVQKTMPPFMQLMVRLGKSTLQVKNAGIEFLAFLGQACVTLASTFRHPARLRLNSITHQMETIGIDALPIIGLIAFVISTVLAYQGQVQLRPLGVEQYTVNLIAISVLREMGVLLTAIIIAGRSGSAFTAEIGVMKVREEIDALRTIGFRPFELLVLPRLIALVLVLPLLTLFADIMGLFGGALLSMLLIDISLPEYLERVRQAVTWKDFFVGMIKAPVFAFVIALVGCRHGLKVSGSAESVGKETTASVVESIFLVLVLDGLFSIYFHKVNL